MAVARCRLGVLTAALLLASTASAEDPFAFTVESDPPADVFAFDDPFAMHEVLPDRFQYDDGVVLKPELLLWPDTRRSQLHSTPAPSRYRTDSILRYTRKLENGMILRVKLPMRLRKIVKVELRF